jgi:dsDNA-specific endonuclease/ATPase MutS2
MTDTTTIEEAVRESARLRGEIATLREVNRAQADNYERLAEKYRKAQERIRAAEAERDRAWNEAIDAAWLRVKQQVDFLLRHEEAELAEGMEAMADAIRSLTKEGKDT